MTAPTDHQPVEQQHVERRRVVSRSSFAPVDFGPGMLVGGLAALGVVISLFLPWRDGGVHASDIPLEFLWDTGAGAADPSLLILLIPFALILAIGAFVPMGAALRAFGSIGVLVVAVVFAFQLDNALGDVGGDLGSSLASGFYLAVISSIIGFASALIPAGRTSRRDVVETDVVDDRVR
jgi:hypothetical protein